MDNSGLTPVPFTDVAIKDAFWAPHIRMVQSETLPHLFGIAQEQGKLDNFVIVAGRKTGCIKLHNCPDSDVYKPLKAASYSLVHRENPELEGRLDELIALIAAAQSDDGYINTQFMISFEHPASPARKNPRVRRCGYGPSDRWRATVERWPYGIGKLYCLGHLFEAAVSHYNTTGKRAFLNVAVRAADNLDRTFDQSKPLDYADHPPGGDRPVQTL